MTHTFQLGPRAAAKLAALSVQEDLLAERIAVGVRDTAGENIVTLGGGSAAFNAPTLTVDEMAADDAARRRDERRNGVPDVIAPAPLNVPAAADAPSGGTRIRLHPDADYRPNARLLKAAARGLARLVVSQNASLSQVDAAATTERLHKLGVDESTARDVSDQLAARHILATVPFSDAQCYDAIVALLIGANFMKEN